VITLKKKLQIYCEKWDVWHGQSLDDAISKGASDVLDYNVSRLFNLPLKTKSISTAKTVTVAATKVSIYVIVSTETGAIF